MKIRSICAILTLSTAAVAAKVPSSQVVDSGSFGVFVNGKRVATETFKIEQRTGTSLAHSELKAQDGAAQRSDLEMSSQGNIIHYGWQELQPTKAEISVDPKDEFLTEVVNTGANQKVFSVPHLLPHSTPILDDNIFLHREILMWRYLATGCSAKAQGLSCDPAPQQFGVLVPAQHQSETVTIGFKAKEKIVINGQEQNCSAFTMQADNGDWVIYLNDQQKVVRMVASATGLEVVRD